MRWQALNTSPSWIASTGVSRLPESVRQADKASATIAGGMQATSRKSPCGSPTAAQNAPHKDNGTAKKFNTASMDAVAGGGHIVPHGASKSNCT